MTGILETPTRQSPGQSDSWDSLPPAEPVIDLAPAPEDKPDATDKVEPGVCATCREPIIREPGARGRMPKYHPDCRPLKSAGIASAAKRNTKAEAEADQVIQTFKAAVVKACIMLSMIDKYDAFCVMVSLPQISENLRGVLIRYEPFRREMLALKGGGSVIALVLSVLMAVLPIAAHHGLIPSKTIAQVLANAPFTLFKIQQKLAEGEAALTKLMEEQIREAQSANAARAKAQQDG